MAQTKASLRQEWKPSPQRISEAFAAALQAVDSLSDEERQDYQLVIDTVEGESDLLELLEAIAVYIKQNEQFVETGKARLKRFENRASKGREIFEKIAVAAGLMESRPLVRSLFTAGFENDIQQPRIVDKDKLPRECMKPDFAECGKRLRRGIPTPGAVLSNPGRHLVLRFR